MAQVEIHYSIRKNNNNDLPTLRLFSDEQCAVADQELYGWFLPCYGKFTLDVKGVAYVSAVTTREEYLQELEHLPKTPKTLKIIKKLSKPY